MDLDLVIFLLITGWPTAEPNLMSQYLQKVSGPLRNHGFTENTVDEIVRSIHCLASHGILTLESSNPESAKSEPTRAITPPIPTQSQANVNSYGLVTNQNEDVEEIEVQENVIGAVIGPAGRSIIELQQFSGARIQISKKGAFSPGTRNRVVTISGARQAVQTAKYLIEKRIQEEDESRIACY